MSLAHDPPWLTSLLRYNQAGVSRNKQLRKRIAGQLGTIIQHETKIEHELGKPAPDVGLIRKWEKDIDIARKRMRKLEQRLEK